MRAASSASARCWHLKRGRPTICCSSWRKKTADGPRTRQPPRTMRTADIARLLALAVIWSASFVFIRVLAPVLGPVWVATSRVLVAGVALTAGFVMLHRHVDVARHWRAYLFVGVLNSSLPFLLFAFAALTLPASYLVILNTALPLFGAVASAIWLAEPLDAAKLAGLIAGAAGVWFVSRAGPVVPDAAFLIAVAASL